MLGHVGISVPNLNAAKTYYDEILPMLGYGEFFSTTDEFSYMPMEGRRGAYLFFYPARQAGEYSGDRPGLQHLAFAVPTRSAVRAVHQKVTELGGRVVHAPMEFPQYPPPYFATFWLDPIGVMLEAVCHHNRD